MRIFGLLFLVATMVLAGAAMAQTPSPEPVGNRAFLDAARAAHKSGKTAEQAAAELKLPDKFKDYQLARAAANFTTIFGELSKK